ncbi:MAG: MgtC/SapB family protein [Pseudomonadota bacterium]
MDWNDIRLLRLDYWLPLVAALVAGGLVGIERGHSGKPAGFRTHALISVTSALLMLAAHHQTAWIGDVAGAEIVRIDPVRMAHGVLTGVGFLCGGVIFREGFTVHGLTTAASLWITSALGTLYGMGFWSVAISGTLLTLFTLRVLHLIDRRLPQREMAELLIRYRRDQAPDIAVERKRLQDLNLAPTAFSARLLQEGQVVEHGSTVIGGSMDQIDGLVRVLRGDPAVLEFEIIPRNN